MSDYNTELTFPNCGNSASAELLKEYYRPGKDIPVLHLKVRNAAEHDIQSHMNQYQQVVLSRHSVAGIAESLCSGSCEIDQENDDRDGNYQPGICSHRLKDARYAYSIRCYCILHLKPSIRNVLIPIKDYIRHRRVIPWRTLFWQPIGNF